MKLPMWIDAKAFEAIGLAGGVYLLVWMSGRLLFRKLADPPVVTLHLLALALGLWAAGKVFYASAPWLGHLGAVLIFCAVLFGWALFDRFVNLAYFQNRKNVGMPIILRQMEGVLVVLLALAAILKWGYKLELTGLLATSGIAAVILGFAMQDLLANVIAGFSIHTTRAYQVGDWLLLGEGGDRAKVMEINWRSTRLVNNDQISFEIPNSEMVKNRIINLNQPTRDHGVRIVIGLDYDTPPAMAKEVLLLCAKNAQGVLESPAPVVFLKDFADSSVNYELRFWMRYARLFNITCDEIRTNVWYELGRRNMRIPYPTRSLETREPNVPTALLSAREKAAAILRGGASLACLSEEEAGILVERGQLLLFGPKEALVRRGEAGDSMYVMLEGQVEVIGKDQEGPRVVMARLGAGECFGELSLVTGEPRGATVRAVGDVLVLEIRKADLAPLMERNPDLAESIGNLLEQRRTARAESLSQAGRDAAESITAAPGNRSLVKRIREFFSSGDSGTIPR